MSKNKVNKNAYKLKLVQERMEYLIEAIEIRLDEIDETIIPDILGLKSEINTAKLYSGMYDSPFEPLGWLDLIWLIYGKGKQKYESKLQELFGDKLQHEAAKEWENENDS